MIIKQALAIYYTCVAASPPAINQHSSYEYIPVAYDETIFTPAKGICGVLLALTIQTTIRESINATPTAHGNLYSPRGYCNKLNPSHEI